MPLKVRRAVFAGSWYPAQGSECEREIKAFIEKAGVTPPHIRTPVGGIVPHAGWQFSGNIACNVIHRLHRTESGQPDVLVVFGMHLNSLSPNVMMPRGAWETPFGTIPVAEDLADELAKAFPFHLESADRFTQDNTIELQLPFIKYFFPNARILGIGASAGETALAIGQAVVDISRRHGLAIQVIGSTDLTHYGSHYGLSGHGIGLTAVAWVKKENDRRVIEAMLELDPQRVMAEAREHQNSCCPGAAAAAIQAGRCLGAKAAETVNYATSYDRSPGDSFVGYAGIIF